MASWSKYTEEDQRTVDQAKFVHKATTKAADRALTTAERTRELAGLTLDEARTQGNRLVIIENDLDGIDADAKEAKGLLKYMKRCCLCFLCSCCCDSQPTAGSTRSRKAPTQARDRGKNKARDTSGKVEKARTTNIPADARAPVNEEKARSELFGLSAAQTVNPQDSAQKIGEGLDDADRLELQNETKAQERTLVMIDNALGDIKHMSMDMAEELSRQAEHVDRLNDHVHKTNENIGTMNIDAKRHFRL